jgi:hypothetical protein
LVVSARPAAAQNFTGFYQVTSATDQGDGTTQVTLSVDIFNYRADDAVNAVVTLGDSVNPLARYGSFEAATISSGGDVILTAQFLVPNYEYQRWGQNGMTPTLSIEFIDSNNNPETNGVALTQAPVNTD